MSDELKTLQVAALLHDIGKFWQRTEKQVDKKSKKPLSNHQRLSKEFVDKLEVPSSVNKNLLSNLVLRHHDYKELSIDLRVEGLPRGSVERRLARIVSNADNISSAMDREHDEEGEARRPLIPVFPQIFEGKNTNKDTYYYPPSELSLNKLLQKGRYDTDEIDRLHSRLWDGFCGEIKKVSTNDFNVWINSIYYLLQKYTSFILSAGYQTRPDIPLFDHLKTTSAIAVSMYRWRKENNWLSPSSETKAYLLIEGDLSGIQNFIFDIAGPQDARPGTSKRLRGRSFWLTLLMDAVATKILDQLELPQMNLLWNTGGHFLILAPNLKECTEKLEKIKKEVNKKLLQDYDGKLFIGLSWIECSANGLKTFSDTKERLTQKTNRLKRQKFNEFIGKELKFDVMGKNDLIEKYCMICGNPLKDSEIETRKCGLCSVHEELGQKLAKAEYIIKGLNLKHKPKNNFTLPFGITYFFDLDSIDEIDTKDRMEIYKLNDTDFLKEELVKKYPHTSFGFKFLGNTVPRKRDGDVMSFSELGQLSKGAPKLGVLKADVDNLGKIFAIGLDPKRRSISRIHTLSSMLELFFTGYLNKICERYYVYAEENLCHDCKEMIEERKKSKRVREIKVMDKDNKLKYVFYRLNDDDLERNICENCKKQRIYTSYITYSGGDDLLIIGPYDDIIRLAQEIREEFKEFTCQNPDINISAGVAVVDPHYPVARTVKLADGNLELAKSHLKVKDDVALKNSIALFNECVCWDNLPEREKKGFEEIFDVSKELENRVEDKDVSKGFVYSLLRMWKDTFGGLGSLKEIEGYRGSGQFIKKSYMPHLKYQLIRNIKKQEVRWDIEEKIKPVMPWIRIPVSWVSLRTRR